MILFPLLLNGGEETSFTSVTNESIVGSLKISTIEMFRCSDSCNLLINLINNCELPPRSKKLDAAEARVSEPRVTRVDSHQGATGAVAAE